MVELTFLLIGDADRSEKEKIYRRYFDCCQGIAGFTVTGHAQFAPAGSDIVCAGFSALFFALLGGVERQERILNQKGNAARFLSRSDDWWTLWLLDPGIPPETQGILSRYLELFIIGTERIALQYPGTLQIQKSPPPPAFTHRAYAG